MPHLPDPTGATPSRFMNLLCLLLLMFIVLMDYFELKLHSVKYVSLE